MSKISRRDFLAASVTTSLFTIVPSHVLAQTAHRLNGKSTGLAHDHNPSVKVRYLQAPWVNLRVTKPHRRGKVAR